MANSTRKSRLARDQHLITGYQAHLASASTLVDGVLMTGADVIALLQGRVSKVTTVVTSRAAYQAAVKAAAASESSTAATVSALIESVYVAYGNAPDILSDFGLAPHRKGVLTPAQRIAATEKAKATRAARHTMGKKQKAAITGQTPATTATATPAVTPAATPATQK